MEKWSIEICGLWVEAEGGYSVNDVYSKEYFDMPKGSSDLAVARYVKRYLSIQGVPRESSLENGECFAWRNGTIGYIVDYLGDSESDMIL